MIETFEDDGPWTLNAQGTNKTTSMTRLQGAASLQFDKTVGGVEVIAERPLYVPLDVEELRNASRNTGNQMLSCWFNLPSALNVTELRVYLVYERSAAHTYVKADRFSKTAGIAAGWNEVSVNLATPTVETGAPGSAERRRGAIWLAVSVVFANPGDLLAAIKVDALYVTRASVLVMGNDRLTIPNFDTWLRNRAVDNTINVAGTTAELVFGSAWEQLSLSLGRVLSPTVLRGLRTFKQFADANVGWGAARDGRLLCDTFVDAASGRDESDPTRLNLDDTTDVEFVVTRLGLTAHLFLGPNEFRQWEVAEVKSVVAGSHVLCVGPLAHNYASGDPVRAAASAGNDEANYYPNLVAQGAAVNLVTAPGGIQFDAIAQVAE